MYTCHTAIPPQDFCRPCDGSHGSSKLRQLCPSLQVHPLTLGQLTHLTDLLSLAIAPHASSTFRASYTRLLMFFSSISPSQAPVFGSEWGQFWLEKDLCLGPLPSSKHSQPGPPAVPSHPPAPTSHCPRHKVLDQAVCHLVVSGGALGQNLLADHQAVTTTWGRGGGWVRAWRRVRRGSGDALDVCGDGQPPGACRPCCHRCMLARQPLPAQVRRAIPARELTCTPSSLHLQI